MKRPAAACDGLHKACNASSKTSPLLCTSSALDCPLLSVRPSFERCSAQLPGCPFFRLCFSDTFKALPSGPSSLSRKSAAARLEDGWSASSEHSVWFRCGCSMPRAGRTMSASSIESLPDIRTFPNCFLLECTTNIWGEFSFKRRLGARIFNEPELTLAHKVTEGGEWDN